jgi:outer membrane protein insertion porin family
MRGLGYGLLGLVMLGMAATSAWSLETVQVMVLPFDVNAAEGEDYLSRELPRAVRAFLEQEGATVVDAGIPAGASWRAATRRAGGIRQFGVSRGADYVIWGSLTRLGQKISIDARMIATLSMTRPSSPYPNPRIFG